MSERRNMVKFILVLLLFMQVGCSGLATFTMVTAGTFSGEVLHDVVEDYLEDKEENAEKK
jgi:hypothetical protein